VTVQQAHEQYVATAAAASSSYVTMDKTNNKNNKNTTTTYCKRLSATAAFLLPFRALTYREGKKDRDILAITYVFREGIKFKNTDVAAMTRLFETLANTIELLSRAAVSATNSTTTTTHLLSGRLEVGMWLRTVKELWVTSLLLATVVHLHNDEQEKQQVNWIELAHHVYTAVIAMNLDTCWEMKPILDGKALIKALELPQGPIVGTYREEQLRWMLMNPTGSLEDCTAHLHSYKRKLLDKENDQSTRVSDGQLHSNNMVDVNENSSQGKAIISNDSELNGDDVACAHYDKKVHTS
jgi:tRNA nucleotidyltransferase (CCA-adding enzyme)